MLTAEMHTVWNCSFQIEIQKKIARSSALCARQPTTDVSEAQSSIYGGHVAIAITIWRQILRRFQGHQSSYLVFMAVA